MIQSSRDCPRNSLPLWDEFGQILLFPLKSSENHYGSAKSKLIIIIIIQDVKLKLKFPLIRNFNDMSVAIQKSTEVI